jgi:hypothetical protein
VLSLADPAARAAGHAARSGHAVAPGEVPVAVQAKYKSAKDKVALHFKTNPSKVIDPMAGDDTSYVTVVEDGSKYRVEMFAKGLRVQTAALN